jgi:hypothetical protein
MKEVLTNDRIHARLFLNHTSVVGLMFGLVFLIAGIKRSSAQPCLQDASSS